MLVAAVLSKCDVALVVSIVAARMWSNHQRKLSYLPYWRLYHSPAEKASGISPLDLIRQDMMTSN